MARFPYFGLPFQYPYYNRYYNQNQYHNFNYSEDKQNSNIKSNHTENDNLKDSANIHTEEVSSSVENKKNILSNTRKDSLYMKNNIFSLPFTFDFNGLSNSDTPILELFGIKLYLDDIIILCLLFLLYKEDVKDEMLFIALILLLLG